MAKAKSPLLSLGARGTIADTLTYQKRGQGTIVRDKPIPKDPYSLNQAYQRWDYRDYAYLWTLLSNSEKQVHRTKASRYHITGFSHWMRENLKDLPNLIARWHLDEKAGPIAYDSSRNLINATIIGATPVTGPIDGALSFDGINDYATVPYSPILDLSLPFSIELFFSSAETRNFRGLIGKVDYATTLAPIALYRPNANALRFHIFDGTAYDTFDSTLNPFDGLTRHVVATADSSFLKLYFNGSLDKQIPTTTVPATGANYRWTFGQYYPGGPCLCVEDNIIIHDRVLDDAEILRHSQRGYPA